MKTETKEAKGKRAVLPVCMVLLGIAVFFAGYGIGSLSGSAEKADRNQILEKGETAILEGMKKEGNYGELLQIAEAPTAYEEFLHSMGSGTEAHTDLLQEELEKRGFLVMQADWRQPRTGDSFRKYFVISNAEEKTIVEMSETIPLADGTISAASEQKTCEEAEEALRQSLTASSPDIEWEVCRTDPTETGEQIRQLAGTRKSIEYGWTKEFLENRFLIVHTVSQIPGELTPEGEPYVRDRNYIMIRSVATDRWDVWDWYEPGSEVILR